MARGDESPIRVIASQVHEPSCGPADSPLNSADPHRARRLHPFSALDRLSEFAARGELHLKNRSFAWRRHHPDPAPVHLDDLLGDGVETFPWRRLYEISLGFHNPSPSYSSAPSRRR